MRADHDGGLALATQIRPEVARLVGLDLDRKRGGGFAKQRTRLEPLRRPAQSTAAVRPTRPFGEHAQIGNDALGVEGGSLCRRHVAETTGHCGPCTCQTFQMSIEIRCPTDEEWPEVCEVDGRAFGTQYTPEEIEERRPLHDLSRFRIGLDRGRIVAVAGSYALDVTLPGGRAVPMGGVTWVSTVVTHRRQGLMRAVVGAVHDDIDARGEPLASLYASEGSIYENVGYGIATRVRVTSIDRRAARIREEFRAPSGSVRYLEGDEIVPTISKLWEQYRRLHAGEVNRSDEVQQLTYEWRS